MTCNKPAQERLPVCSQRTIFKAHKNPKQHGGIGLYVSQILRDNLRLGGTPTTSDPWEDAEYKEVWLWRQAKKCCFITHFTWQG